MKTYSDLEEMELYKAPESRTRSRTSFVLAAPSSIWYPWNTSQNPKPVKPTKGNEGTQTGLKESMSDFVIDRFKERSSNGETFSNPMSKTSVTWDVKSRSTSRSKSVVGNTTYYFELEGLHLNGASSGADALISTMVSRAGVLGNPDYLQMDALAATYARSKIDQPQFEGLVSIGELGQTLRYLKNPLATGLKLADKLHRRIDKINPSNGDVFASLASVYLEFRYAVRPLVKEVESALLNLQNAGLRSDRKTARGMQLWSNSGVFNTSAVPIGGTNTTNWYYDESCRVEKSFSLRTGFLYQHTLSTGLSDQWGIRLSDIPTAMWELIPMSFIYDWVTNVGDFIGALTPRAGVNILSTWTSREETIELDLSGSNYRIIYPGWSGEYSNGPSQASGKVVFKSRSPIVSAPSIAWRGFDKISSDVLKIVDLLSIFDQKLNNSAQTAMRKQSGQDALVRKGERLTTRLNRFR